MPKSAILKSIKRSVDACLPSCTDVDQYRPLNGEINRCFKCNKICQPFAAIQVKEPVVTIMMLLNGIGPLLMIFALRLFILHANTAMLIRSHFLFHASIAAALAYSFAASFAVALLPASVASYNVLPIMWSTILTLSLSIIFVKSARFSRFFRFGGADK